MLRRDARAHRPHSALLTLLALGVLAGCGETVVVARELAQNVSLFDASAGPSDAANARLDAAPVPPPAPSADAGRSPDSGSTTLDAGAPDASVPDDDPTDDDGNPFDID